MNQHERAAQASIFRAALEDGVIGRTLEQIEADFIAEWKRSRTPEERENCWRTVNVIQILRQRMAAIAAGERDSVTAIRLAK